MPPLWDRAKAGDVAAARTVLRVIEPRSRILGLIGPGRSRREDADGDMRGKTVVLLKDEVAALRSQI
jgi:hypothetical protein